MPGKDNPAFPGNVFVYVPTAGTAPVVFPARPNPQKSYLP